MAKQKLQEDIEKEALITAVEPAKPVVVPPVFDIAAWSPKTALGRAVKEGKLTAIDQILNAGLAIKEPEIVDALLPGLEFELLLVGQAKGKFGGGKRRAFRQTQKKTAEGNKPHFVTVAATGNRDGFVGLGYGKAKETVPSREKAIRNAKLRIIKIRRGCGSWQCGCRSPHSLPFKVRGKSGSVELELLPAPKGTGLCIETECAKFLALAGIKDIWSRSSGTTSTKLNMVLACYDALRKTMRLKIKAEHVSALGIAEGRALIAPSVPTGRQEDE